MFQNIDLILLALLHASFVFFVLLIAIIILFFLLLLTFSLALLTIFLLDLYNYFSILYEYFEIVKGDLEMGLVLIVISIIHHGVDFFLVSKPSHKRKFDKFEVKDQQSFTSHIHVLKTIQ
ncbi:hypothetical protein MtrunA17_Chr1g0157591 [Medicago truncatula]|uniref:Transmembrane protein n=1 Tax=Medicago truncatula TaxID=3880 RepID=A0A396JHH3_MEDTR|nr:hypothetical protein MtrunA17_Chr1g0157591 [Medicago truncatula]